MFDYAVHSSFVEIVINKYYIHVAFGLIHCKNYLLLETAPCDLTPHAVKSWIFSNWKMVSSIFFHFEGI